MKRTDTELVSIVTSDDEIAAIVANHAGINWRDCKVVHGDVSVRIDYTVKSVGFPEKIGSD